VLDKLRELRPEVVVLAAAWFRADDDTIRRGLEATLSALQADPGWNPQVIVVGSVPIWHKTLPRLLASDILGGEGGAYSQRGLDPEGSRKDKLIGGLVGNRAVFFSPFEEFCGREGCLRYLSSGDSIVPFAYDYGHLTEEASSLIASRLLAAIDAATKRKQYSSIH
jgi:hypothetical protein